MGGDVSITPHILTDMSSDHLDLDCPLLRCHILFNTRGVLTNNSLEVATWANNSNSTSACHEGIQQMELRWGGGVSKIPGVRNIFYFIVRVNRFSLFLLYLWFKNRKWKSKLQLQLIRSDTGTFFCSVLWLGVLLLGWPLESNLLEFWAQIIHNVNDTKIRSSQTMGGKGAFLISVLYARDLWEVCVD